MNPILTPMSLTAASEPALNSLGIAKRPADTRVVGFSRTPYTHEAWRKELAEPVAKFAGDKLKHLVNGYSRSEAETKARRQLDKLPVKCAVPVAHTTG